MKSFSVRIYVIILAALLLSGCGYTRLASMNQNVYNSWDNLEELFNERVELSDRLIHLSRTGEISPLIADMIKETVEELKSSMVLPGSIESMESYLLLQEDLAGLLSLVFRKSDFFDSSNLGDYDHWIESLAEGNTSIALSWELWEQNRDIFNLYVKPFPRSLISKWLGFQHYDIMKLSSESFQVEMPLDFQL